MTQHKRGPEEILHRQVADWLRWAHPNVVWWHSPNGARMSRAQAGIHKALGMRSGVPDIALVTSGGKAAFIELKAPKGRLSDSQKAFAENVTSLGADWAVCHSFEAVEKTLKGWGII